MATTERQASTFDENQEAILPQIEHRGHCYFVFKDKPRMATQSSGARESYFFSFSIGTESTTAFFASGTGQSSLSPLTDEPICEVLFGGGFYTILAPAQFAPYVGISSAASSHVNQAPADAQLERRILSLINSYQHEQFDQDVASDFTNALDALIRDYGKLTIPTIDGLLRSKPSAMTLYPRR